MNLPRIKKDPIVGGFFDPMIVLADEKLLTKAGCELIVVGMLNRCPQGIVGSNRGTQSAAIGGTLLYRVGGILFTIERRVSSNALLGGRDVMASLMIVGS